MQGGVRRIRRNLRRVWRSFHGMRWNPPRIRRGFCGMRRGIRLECMQNEGFAVGPLRKFQKNHDATVGFGR